ncbi:uncharacterized protein LOC110465225 [Mizuhopecten yessoensis]|uniref:uncharacterized protein LOC110465225 n=1 Tax=Mizuhopecten yessoensis TaxID=6573 RepID=UPI000B458015|nr:uncharacterized protein LOC110465225 [Mizuhopecten yessoensis]
MESWLFKTRMVIFIILTGQCECSVCPEDSLLMQNNTKNWCIWFVNSTETLDSIQNICKDQGGLMFPIENATVQSYLENTLAKTLIDQGIYQIWLNYNVTSGATFEGVQQTYTNFDNGTTGECVGIPLAPGVYTWRKMDCSGASKGICYKTLDCPPHSMFVLPYDICFWTTTSRKTAIEGYNECMADGGGLAVIPNGVVYSELNTTFKHQIVTAHSTVGNSNDLWVGVTDVCTENDFITFEGGTVPYFPWQTDQPNDPGEPNPQNCVIMRIADNLYWHDKDCDEQRISLCSKSLNDTTLPTLNLPCLTTTAVMPTTGQVLCKFPAYISPNDTETINKMTEQIKKEMLIDTKNTSVYRRSLVCADDPRPSATYIGVTAAVVLTFIGCLLIFPDIVTIIKSLTLKLRPKH